MSSVDTFLRALSAAPSGQIDPAVTSRIEELIGEPDEVVRAGLKHVLDDCAAYGLASDFAMLAMHQAWLQVGGEQ